MTPQLARRVLAGAVVLGLLADWLLRAGPWRAGFVVWALLLLGAGLYIGQLLDADDAAAGRERRLLIGSAGALALLLVLRDADMLFALDLFALFVACFLIAWRALGRRLVQLEPRDALIGVATAAVAVVGGAPTLALQDADAASLDAGWRGSYKAIGLGSLVALPVLLAVTGLLASADPLFAGFLEQSSTLFDTVLVEHLFVIGFATWVSAGALRGSLVPVGVRSTMFRAELNVRFPAVAPVLGGLAILLSAWIGLQVRTLFGGAEYVATTAGVTVANYARQGFFELVVIAGIVLAVLLVVDDVLDRTAEQERRSFRLLGQVLVGLVAAVLVSAVFRLALYLRFFGLTEDRVLALAVLVWVALVLAWFAMTVLRGVRTRFAPGVLVLSAIWLGGLNAVNPERWIVETNLQRAARGMAFDVAYHAKLSADALPSLLAVDDRLSEAQRAELRLAIDKVWADRAAERPDWRWWSVPYALGAKRLGL